MDPARTEHHPGGGLPGHGVKPRSERLDRVRHRRTSRDARRWSVLHRLSRARLGHAVLRGARPGSGALGPRRVDALADEQHPRAGRGARKPLRLGIRYLHGGLADRLHRRSAHPDVRRGILQPAERVRPRGDHHRVGVGPPCIAARKRRERGSHPVSGRS